MSYAIKVEPGSKVNLKKIETRQDGGLTKEEAKEKLDVLATQIHLLQDLLYAASDRSVLVVLQGMDTSGKDGTIKSVFRAIDPLGARSLAFKVPSDLELSHDFLWRVHNVVPPKGILTIFNRSHYEDVLVARVKNLVPAKSWRTRYDHINAFEHLLTDSGTIILKFFLHISKDEQEERLLDREKEVDKSWKLSVSDWEDRELWDDYQKAYEDALWKCSTKQAPWYVIPADRKWFRDLAVAETIVNTLRPMTKSWRASLAELGEERKAELEAMRNPIKEEE